MSIKAEATPGTYIAVTADNIRWRDIEMTLNQTTDDSKFANGHHAEDTSIAGQITATITANCRVTYSGTATTAPTWWTGAYSCGLLGIGWSAGSEVVIGSAAQGISLVPREEQDDTTYSICIYDTEIGDSGGPVTTLYKFKGCIGNMIISADTTGAPVMAGFTWQGVVEDIVDGTVVVPTATDTSVGEPFLSSTFETGTTIAANGTGSGGTSHCISSFSFDIGNQITPVVCQSAAYGVSHFVITGRQPRFSCNPLAVKQATYDWLNQWDTEATPSIYLAIGSSANYKLEVPDAQLLTFANASREGLVGWDVNYKFLENGVPGSKTVAALTNEDTFALTHGVWST